MEGDSFRNLSCGRAYMDQLTSRYFAPVLLQIQEAVVQPPRFRNSSGLQRHSAGLQAESHEKNFSFCKFSIWSPTGGLAYTMHNVAKNFSSIREGRRVHKSVL